MSNQRRPPRQASALDAARARNAAGQRGRQSRANRTIWVAAALVTVVGIAAIAAVASGGTNKTSPPPPPSTVTRVVGKATSVPPSVFGSVGIGSAGGLPQKIKAPPFTSGAKPKVLYIGAEYCPYCATERWPLVLALSRFGTFSHLGLTHSSSKDVYADTQTFSFHSSTYRSQYLVFEAVEEKTNQLVGGDYGRLDTPTAEQQRIFRTYNAPPYVPANSAGSIPFIYLGGKFLSSGASYSPDVLQDKSAEDIASSLSNAGSPIAQGVVGTANTFVAALCTLTGNQPGDVCSGPEVTTILPSLG